MPKQTRLGEDADIYQPRIEQSEKQKLKDMTPRARMAYLWEYYKIHAFIVILAIALVSYIIYTIATPNIKPQFYAAMINNTIDAEILEEYKNEFTEYLELDPETENVEFNTTFIFSQQNKYSIDLKQVLSTYIAAKEIDVIIAPESEFKAYAYHGFLAKLSDQLPTDIYSSLTDYFYISDLTDDPEKNVYGIYLTDTKLYRENADNTDPYVLGIVGNYQHEDNTIEFIRTLFQNE